MLSKLRRLVQTTPSWRDVRGGGQGMGGPSSAAPPRTKGAKYTRPTHHFPRQACQLCDEPRVFETRSSFSEHLKIHKYVWVKGTYCIPLQQAMGHMRGKVGPRRRPQSFSRGCGASPPRKTPPRGSYRAVPPPTFIQWQRGGAASPSGTIAPLIEMKVPTTRMGLPPPRIPQMAVATSVQAFTPFSGAGTITSSAQGSAAGPVKVETLVDLLGAAPFDRGQPTEATRRKKMYGIGWAERRVTLLAQFYRQGYHRR